MPTIEPKTLRFLALLSAPLFVLLRSKLGIDIPESTQDLLIGAVMTYILGSHGKEAILAKAELAATTASAKVITPADAAAALADKPVTP